MKSSSSHAAGELMLLQDPEAHIALGPCAGGGHGGCGKMQFAMLLERRPFAQRDTIFVALFRRPQLRWGSFLHGSILEGPAPDSR